MEERKKERKTLRLYAEKNKLKMKKEKDEKSFHARFSPLPHCLRNHEQKKEMMTSLSKT